MTYEKPWKIQDAAIERSGAIAEADALGAIDTSDPAYRADVLLKEVPDPDLAEEAYIAATDRLGAAIVNEYRRKLLLRERRRR